MLSERVSEAQIITTEVDSKICLLNQVRATKTLEGGFLPYKDARISVRTLNPSVLHPLAKYVLTSNLLFVREMRDEIIETDSVDIFTLDRIFGNPIYFIGPPVVEISDGVPAIVDGLHRCMVAKRKRMPITVLFVEGVNPNFPTISTPVTWNDIREYQTKPEVPELLRNLRNGIRDESGDLRKYYRDFGYLGSTGRRPRSGQCN